MPPASELVIDSQTRATESFMERTSRNFPRLDSFTLLPVALYFCSITGTSFCFWLFSHSWTSSTNHTVTPWEIFLGWGKFDLLLHQRHSVDLLIVSCRASSLALSTDLCISDLLACFRWREVWSVCEHKKRAVIFYDPLFFCHCVGSTAKQAKTAPQSLTLMETTLNFFSTLSLLQNGLRISESASLVIVIEKTG